MKKQNVRTKIYTANIRYNAHDAISVCATKLSVFAPPWSLIYRYKHAEITFAEFAEEYKRHLDESFLMNNKPFLGILKHGTVTFTCVCHPLAKCHRHVLADWFVENFPDKCEYVAERKRYLCNLQNL